MAGIELIFITLRNDECSSILLVESRSFEWWSSASFLVKAEPEYGDWLLLSAPVFDETAMEQHQVVGADVEEDEKFGAHHMWSMYTICIKIRG